MILLFKAHICIHVQNAYMHVLCIYVVAQLSSSNQTKLVVVFLFCVARGIVGQLIVMMYEL